MRPLNLIVVCFFSVSCFTKVFARTKPLVAPHLERVLRSVVTVHGTRGGKPVATTGFVWSGQGEIIANGSGVRDTTGLKVSFPQVTGTFNAVAKIIFIVEDLALIQLSKRPGDLASRIPALGDINSTVLGEDIYVVGSPFGLSFSVFKGIVASLERKVEINGKVAFSIFQIDAASNPTHSGGPVVDTKGRIIGLRMSLHNKDSQGIGFVTPIAHIRRAMKDYRDNGKLDAVAWHLSFKHATTIEHQGETFAGTMLEIVGDKSPLKEHGFKGLKRDSSGTVVGGDIVYQVNDSETPSPMQLNAVLGSATKGSKLKIKYIRFAKGKPREFRKAKFVL